MKRKKKEYKAAVIYARVSGPAQLKGSGLQRQFETCLEYARRHGYRVVGVFSEQRGSSDTYQARKQAERMARYHKGIIICESLDRWTRKPNDVDAIINGLVELVGLEVLDIWENAVFKKQRPIKASLEQGAQ